MKPSSKLDIWLGVIGIAFIIYGMMEIKNPSTGNRHRYVGNHTGGSRYGWTENVTETTARVYGGLAIALGVGIIAAVLYSAKK